MIWRRSSFWASHPRPIRRTLSRMVGARSGSRPRVYIDTRALLQSDVSVATRLPQRCVDAADSGVDEPPVFRVELDATSSTCDLFCCRPYGGPRTRALRIDKKAALDGLIKCSLPFALGAALINLFLRAAFRAPEVRTLEYVSKKPARRPAFSDTRRRVDPIPTTPTGEAPTESPRLAPSRAVCQRGSALTNK